MRTAFPLLLISLFCSIYFSCSPYAVQIDYDRHVDFSRYKTYKYIKKGKTDQTSKFQNDLNRKRFAQAIEKELSEKGYQRITDEKPDFKVVYHLRFQKKLDTSIYGYRYWPGTEISEAYIQRRVYQEGSLIIDIIDKEENQLAWRGSAEGVLNEGDDADELINSLVKEILKEFPPHAEK